MAAIEVALKLWLQQAEGNECADTGLKFLAEFVISYCNAEDEENIENHDEAIFDKTFDYVVNLASEKSHVRYRICNFLNLLLDGPTDVDDSLCNKFEEKMLEWMEKDAVATVRTEAARAIARLQDPTNPDCAIIEKYLYHLSYDPSARVRKTILHKLAKFPHTISHFIERLRDVDSDVRRMAILQLSQYPVQGLRISQRLKILLLALRDRDAKVVEVCMIAMQKIDILFQCNVINTI